MISNNTKNMVICEKESFISSFFGKMAGLMFSSCPRPLVFAFSKESKQQLHMMFVFFPIDIIFLDGKMRVVELKKNFRPFTFYNSKEKAKYVIELPAGLIEKSGTRIGDTVIFKR